MSNEHSALLSKVDVVSPTAHHRNHAGEPKECSVHNTLKDSHARTCEFDATQRHIKIERRAYAELVRHV